MIRAFLILLGLTSSVVIPLQAAEVGVTQVLFEERESGIDPYVTRMLLNKRYLRIDEGVDEGDFVLFDRVLGRIHNINHEERTEVVIERKPPVVADLPDVEFSTEREVQNAVPTIGGIVAVEHRFFSEGALCQRSINFDGLLPQFVDALRLYREVLVAQSLASLDSVPEEFKTPCYLALNVTHANAFLEPGFPAMMADEQGRMRLLLEFNKLELSADLFKLPDGYERYYAGDAIR